MRQARRVPLGTGRSIVVITTPSSVGKPVSRNSDTNGPTCLGGKLITPTICRPTSSSAAYSCLDLRAGLAHAVRAEIDPQFPRRLARFRKLLDALHRAGAEQHLLEIAPGDQFRFGPVRVRSMSDDHGNPSRRQSLSQAHALADRAHRAVVHACLLWQLKPGCAASPSIWAAATRIPSDAGFV